MLFNLGLNLGLKFKECKYCSRWFIVRHPRQVHCCSQHRKWYRQERYLEKRAKERRNSTLEYIDPHGTFIKLKSKHHLDLGSMKTGLTGTPLKDPVEEEKKIVKEFKMLGLPLPINTKT